MRPPSLAWRLERYVDARPKVFDWAEANCCHFVARWVAEVEGFDPMDGLSRTADKRAAHRQIRRLGGSLQAAWTNRLGREPLLATLAQIGDPVVVEADGISAVGICAGRDVLCVMESGELARVPMQYAVCAWRRRDAA